MEKKKKNRTLENLKRSGFNESYRTSKPGEEGSYRVKCSQCEAVVINGVACHERGCINER